VTKVPEDCDQPKTEQAKTEATDLGDLGQLTVNSQSLSQVTGRVGRSLLPVLGLSGQ
jgi:hypothetical protein